MHRHWAAQKLHAWRVSAPHPPSGARPLPFFFRPQVPPQIAWASMRGVLAGAYCSGVAYLPASSSRAPRRAI
jgi:hypothetical protein